MQIVPPAHRKQLMQLYTMSTRFSNLIAPLFGLTYRQWSSKEINKHSRTSEIKKKKNEVFTRSLGNGNVCLKSKHVCLDSLCYSGVSSSSFCRSRHLGRGELSCSCGVTNSFVSFINQNCLKAKPSLRPCVRVLRAKGHYCYATKLELGLKGNQNT